jgi:hypothetical protein
VTTKLGGVPITGFMSTTDDVDTYPTHLDNLGKGGVHSVQDLTERDAITAERRTEGMLCYILDDFALYQLSGGVDNSNWLLIFTIINNQVVINDNLPESYIYHGNRDNITVQSPVLLDTRLDLLRVRAADLIIGRPNEKLRSAQVLSALNNGFMYNEAGTVVIKNVSAGDISLSDGMVFRGDTSNMAAEVQRLELDNMPSFFTPDPLMLGGAYNVYTGSANPLSLGEPTKTKSLSIANMASLTNGKIWIGKFNVPLDDPINFGINRPSETDNLPVDFIALPFNKVMIGNAVDRASAQDRIELGNMAKLTYNAIWRGDIDGIPQETNDFTNLALDVENLQTDVANIESNLASLEAEVATIQADLLAINTAIVGIQTELLLIEGAITGIQTEVIGIQSDLSGLHGQVDGLILAISNLRLNNIEADDDVSLYNFKIIDLADPINPTDAVNLQTLISYAGTIKTITGTANQIVVTNDPVTENSNIKIADNVILPGNASAILPSGSTAQRSGDNGSVRYNSELALFEGGTQLSAYTVWRVFPLIPYSDPLGGLYRVANDTFQSRIITGTTNQIDVSDGDGVADNPTIKIADNVILPGNASAVLPSGNTGEQSGGYGAIRYNTGRNVFEGVNEVSGTSVWRTFPQIDFGVANGFVVRTSSNSFTTRSITGTANQIDVTQANGAGGDPVISISNNPVLLGDGSISGDFSVGGDLFGRMPTGMMYWQSNATSTLIPASNAWVKINASITSTGNLNLYSKPSGITNRLQYDGIPSITSHISATVSFSSISVSGALTGIAIFINGVQRVPSASFTTTFNTSILTNISCMTHAVLSTGDYIEVYITCAGTTNTYNVQYLTLTATGS